MKVELKKNSVNQVIKDTNIFEEGDAVTVVGLVIKGRVRVRADGVNLVLGSGNFLGLCDLGDGIHKVTYTAETNMAVYAFAVSELEPALRTLIQVNKDYAPLLVSTLSKYIRELSKIYGELEKACGDTFNHLKALYQRYHDVGASTGAKANVLRSIEELEQHEREEIVDSDKIEYYCACAGIPSEIQKAYFGVSAVITLHHIREEIDMVNALQQQCRQDALYLKGLAEPLVMSDRSLYINVMQQATMLQRMGARPSDVTALFDDVVDYINTLENLLENQAGIALDIDHEFMEESYFALLNGKATDTEGTAGITGEQMRELVGSLDYILEYSELEDDQVQQFKQYIQEFEALSDKFSTDDEVRNLRRGILKIYYPLYHKVFLKDYHSHEKTPLAIDLFLRYGFLSERLISEQILEELLSIENYDDSIGACAVYDMKEWFTLVFEGKKQPSKSEFDLDYDENLRDMKKTGQITAEQQMKLSKDRGAKLEYEMNNVFKTNHRLVCSQVSAFVPFLYTEGCAVSVSKAYLSKEKVNAAVHKLLMIDYSVFYRESLYGQGDNVFTKEYIQQEVYPDILLLPCYGNKGVMWQELSGRKRTSKGRFLLPAFMEGELETELIRLLGRFRWELCRTIQGAAWNNIQIKSLTSEYSDFVQFYRKNRELSDVKKEKLKMQIQKNRNNTREVFVSDYENWIKHEAQGGLVLSKPVREILATYCPFRKELREKVSELPMFRDAMARFQRERGKKAREYELRFKVWTKDRLKIPEEIRETVRFYTEM